LVQNMTFHERAAEWMRQMRLGDWESAWRISDRICDERRGLEPRDIRTGQWLPRHLQWVWDGSPLAGKRVLVRCYHGLGDTIQFSRFVPLLKHSATHVTVQGQAQLLPLLETVAGVDALLRLDDGPCDAQRDVDIEIMELPYALRTTLLTLPNEVPYIRVAANRRKPRDRHRAVVGLVWHSGTWDANRSVARELMETLIGIDGITFRILQRGPALESWSAGAGETPVIRDILDEAAELLALDLLISVDTLSAHLAGALGVPTWTLLPAQADWRWMEDREDTPWYPTMRLLRQSRAGDWHSVILRVTRELTQQFSRG
jgi:hypothetical protein